MNKKRKASQSEKRPTQPAIVVAEDFDGAALPETTVDEPEPEDTTEVLFLNSLEARWNLERRSVIREFYRARIALIRFYMRPEGGHLDMQEAIKRANGTVTDEQLEKDVERVVTCHIERVSWESLDAVFLQSPDHAQALWEQIKEEADDDFRSGHFSARLFEQSEKMQTPWTRAQFIAVRDGFIDDYQPRGTIEISMIDVLAVNFFLWMHWVEQHIHRSTTKPRMESYDYKEWKRDLETWKKDGKKYSDQYTEGAWDIPYQSEADAAEQAAQLADRFRRAYQSQLRAVRDWRRYSAPVTINNPQQVNIAAEGGQQVNLSKNANRS